MISDKNNSNKTYTNQAKRISSNALVLFVRILIITIINLYSIRFVLKGLGNENYGIFSAVVGVVMTCSCVFPILAVSVQRFYSFTMGRNEWSRLRDIFSASINIIIISLIIILILLETLGLYFINTELQIPLNRIDESILIFHLAIITFAFSYLQIPYSAAVFAHEDMNIYAYISCCDSILKLAAALLIGIVPIDELVFYGCALSFISCCTWICYFLVSRRYKECRYKKISENGIYKKLLSFSGWTIYGGIANIGMIQGNNILLNIFFGPIVNAAFGIANNIYNTFTSLSNSMILSFRPQMIRSYAAGDYKYLNMLFSANNKFIIYVLCAIAIPLIFEMDFIMKLWLDDASMDMINFSRLFIIFTIILTLHNPITIIIQASGNIRNYHLIVETIMILCLPITWILFRMKYPPYIAFVSMIILCVLAHAIRLIILKHNYKCFNMKSYICSIIVPAGFIVLIIGIGTWLIHDAIASDIIRFICVTSFSLFTTFLLAYFIGLSNKERFFVNSLLKKILKR